MLKPSSHPACVLSVESAHSSHPAQLQPLTLGVGANLARYQPAQSVMVESAFNSQQLFTTLKGLLLGLRASITPSVQSSPPGSAAKRPTKPLQVRLNRSEPLPKVDRCSTTHLARESTTEQSLVQVRFRGRVIGSVASQPQATLLAQQIDQALNQSTFQVDQLQLRLVDGMPVVLVGDRPLVTFDPQLAQREDCNLERLAVEWVNNLRIALATSPLSFAEAQARMLSLQETGQLVTGLASWYGPYFHGQQTATGEIFDQHDFTAAHPTLPFDTYLKVTNLKNGKSVIVRVNDRGPYVDDRTLDLSREAARSLDSEEAGVIPVEAVIMEPVPASNSVSQAIAKL